MQMEKEVDAITKLYDYLVGDSRDRQISEKSEIHIG